MNKAGSAAQLNSQIVKSNANLIIFTTRVLDHGVSPFLHHLLMHSGVCISQIHYCGKHVAKVLKTMSVMTSSRSGCRLPTAGKRLLIMWWYGRGFNEKKLLWSALTFLHGNSTQWLDYPMYYIIISFSHIQEVISPHGKLENMLLAVRSPFITGLC